MEGVILVVTRENCEALIGKNVRVIVSDSKEEENASEKTPGSAAVEKTSEVYFALCFLELFSAKLHT